MLIHNTTHAASLIFKSTAHRAAPPAFLQRNVLYPFIRPLSSTVPHPKNHKNTNTDPDASTTKEPQDYSSREGQYARTDESVRIQYPGDENIPYTPVSPSHGGIHLKRSLPEFSLEHKVSVVTGGARGLGLAMAQAIVESGSDLAIVDLSGMVRPCPRFEGRELISESKGRRPRNRPTTYLSNIEKRTLT